MLENTFCHVPRVGATTERRLWAAGVHTWAAVIDGAPLPLPAHRTPPFRRAIAASADHLATGNPDYFYERLPSDEQWRLFPQFNSSVAYLDIETTGLSAPADYITTIVVYDGRTIRHYVNGRNLAEFGRDVRQYQVLVTYNGKTFDLPFIRRSLGLALNQAHIDLRYVLASLGIRGGLKGCERQLGLPRDPALADVDGFFAVLLWEEFQRSGNPRALETLLAYNTIDVLNLQTLMHLAYNRKLAQTPFVGTHRLTVPPLPRVPFRPDRATVESIRARTGFRF
ncbi:ribonuclease H-like domain-containing protein [bacterium]|nr:ribonuclease H-like domain-containing protein [bacterium]